MGDPINRSTLFEREQDVNRPATAHKIVESDDNVELLEQLDDVMREIALGK